MKKLNIPKRATLLIAALLIIAFGLGRLTGPKGPSHDSTTKRGEQVTSWTCSMHPQIDQPEPGKCPLCGMDLIPRQSGGTEDLGERMMSMSKSAMKLAEVRTAPVEQKFVDIDIPMVGKVDYDETRVRTISAWTAGRLDRLFVDYTGIPVRKGDHLVEIYSPELYTAQEELQQAIKAKKEVDGSVNESIRRTAKATIDAVHKKLTLLGLNDEQIADIERQTTPSMHTEIKAPIGGIVIHKNAKEGMYVKTGTPIYTVADLSMLWVKLDAYESDLAWIKYGQHVEMRTESFGDKVFKGWISFVDPVLNLQTRTVKVRVVVENESGLLRPNMFVRATVKARVGEEDVVLAAGLEEKWICPMHPEVIKDEAGDCGVCGMDLVSAGQLGYASTQAVKKPVVVPASAVLITGKRAIVYRKVPGKEKPTFEGVQIEVGPRAGDFYIVRSGLSLGDHVVVNGNFKIDSALQLLAKSSMMSPDDGSSAEMAEAVSVSSEFLAQLSPVYDAYLNAQEALALDNAKDAQTSLKVLKEGLSKVDMRLLEGPAHERWMDLLKQFNASLAHVDHISEMGEVREAFLRVSQVAILTEETVGHAGESDVHKAFCSMANDGKGAYWLQRTKDVKNPYYGSEMLGCGEIKESYPAKGKKAETITVSPETSKVISDVVKAYFEVQQALAADNAESAMKKARAMADLLGEFNLSKQEELTLESKLKEIAAASKKLASDTDIQKQREVFASMTAALEKALAAAGVPDGTAVYKAFCPMAFGNKGGHWLQADMTVLNPYFGDAMLRCGEIQGSLGDEDKESSHESH